MLTVINVLNAFKSWTGRQPLRQGGALASDADKL